MVNLILAAMKDFCLAHAMFRHASIIFGHHPIFLGEGQKIFFEHEIFDGFQYWFDILGNRFGCVALGSNLLTAACTRNPSCGSDSF